LGKQHNHREAAGAARRETTVVGILSQSDDFGVSGDQVSMQYRSESR
jgi:hypothetical protein